MLRFPEFLPEKLNNEVKYVTSFAKRYRFCICIFENRAEPSAARTRSVSDNRLFMCYFCGRARDFQSLYDLSPPKLFTSLSLIYRLPLPFTLPPSAMLEQQGKSHFRDWNDKKQSGELARRAHVNMHITSIHN